MQLDGITTRDIQNLKNPSNCKDTSAPKQVTSGCYETPLQLVFTIALSEQKNFSAPDSVPGSTQIASPLRADLHF